MNSRSGYFEQRMFRLQALALCASLFTGWYAEAQAPAASGYAMEALSPAVLDRLVAPIALYPDDLVAIVLPASTHPLQVVQAERFLQKRKQEPGLQLDDKWDDSVKALVNYPDVIKQLSADLDWTGDLGEAVVADQGAVLDAVQAFRRKVRAVGNLESDTKQVVVVEKEVIMIQPADPQVIYVPQYNPTTVVAYSVAPVYFPTPYPVYYYPYPPGAALATGLVWGAAIGAAWNGGHWNTSWGGNNSITINRGDVNIDRGNINTGNINTGNVNTGSVNRASQQPSGGSSAWKSDKRPGQVSSGAGRGSTSSARVGDARASSAGVGFSGSGTTASARQASPMTQGVAPRDTSGSVDGRVAATGNGAGRERGDAFSGYGSGSGARADSSRGASSRSAMASQGGVRTGGAGGGGRGGGGRGR